MKESSSQVPAPKINESLLLFTLAAIQFINILDFMMVMPLGPDFAKDLKLDLAHLGYVGGSYTLAAFVAGLVSSLFLDRFDRRPALCVALLGLVGATALGGFATSLETLLAARVLAGFFGGPATSLTLSIIADVIPPEHRGKAMGVVGGAFGLAAVLGVPMGLKMAELGTWRTPFFGVAALGLVFTILAWFILPSLTLHMENGKPRMKRLPLGQLLGRGQVRLSLLTAMAIFISIFALVPNLSAYLQFNLDYPRSSLDTLYGVGGIISFFTMRAAGKLIDKTSSFLVMVLASTSMAGLVIWMFILPGPMMPILVVFTGFMIFSSARGVAYNTLISKVPLPHERAGFLSIQNAVQHLASSIGAFLSSKLLVEGSHHQLIGMEKVAIMGLIFGCLAPPLIRLVEKNLKPPEALSTSKS